MTTVIKYYLCILFAFTLLFGNNPPLPLYNITNQMHTDLQHGKTLIEKITTTDGSGEHYHGYILIDENIEHVFMAISQLENYPEFMPLVADAEKVLNQNTSNFRYYIELPMGVKYQYQISTIQYESPQSSWLYWKMEDWEENNIEDTWGQWVITPYKNTHLTLVQYQVYTDLGHIPFGFGWIVDFLVVYNLPDVLTNTKRYVESKY